jgi:hypothetical protein
MSDDAPNARGLRRDRYVGTTFESQSEASRPRRVVECAKGVGISFPAVVRQQQGSEGLADGDRLQLVAPGRFRRLAESVLVETIPEGRRIVHLINGVGPSRLGRVNVMRVHELLYEGEVFRSEFLECHIRPSPSIRVDRLWSPV